LRYARKAEAIGADAVTVVGAECGGHPGMDMVGTMVQAALAGREISIPLVVGGGIGSGEQLVAALALGADGVIIGTRFLVAEEIWAHADYKKRLIEASETDTTLVMQTLRNVARALRNATTDEVLRVEAERPGDLKALMPLISGEYGRLAYEDGDWSKGVLAVGQSVAFIDRTEPLAAIVDRLEAEARTALGRIGSLAKAA
jgi:nitronate monooxygenase